MGIPKKKRITNKDIYGHIEDNLSSSLDYKRGYNQACEDWEKFLRTSKDKKRKERE